MRKAKVFVHGQFAGWLQESDDRKEYTFSYVNNYNGEPVSLSMPVRNSSYVFQRFPAFFDGVLPEGYQLEALLRQLKIDRSDYFSQLLAVGEDLVGAVTVEGCE